MTIIRRTPQRKPVQIVPSVTAYILWNPESGFELNRKKNPHWHSGWQKQVLVTPQLMARYDRLQKEQTAIAKELSSIFGELKV